MQNLFVSMDAWIDAAVIAVIAGATNALALWMLFHPHRRRLFFQGVIPKERARLAKSVGELVERELITAEVLANLLQSDEVKSFAVQAAVDGAVAALRSERRSLRELLRGWLDAEGARRAESEPPLWLAGRAAQLLREDEGLARFVDGLCERVSALLDRPVADFLASGLRPALRDRLEEALQALIESGRLRQAARRFAIRRLDEAGGRALGELVPAPLQTALKEVLLAEAPRLAERLAQWLDGPQARGMLSRQTDALIEGFGPIVKFFAQQTDIPGKIAAGVQDFLRDDANQALLAERLADWFDRLFEQPVETLIERVGRESLEQALDALLSRGLSVETAGAWLDRAEEALRARQHQTWRELAGGLDLTESRLKEALRRLLAAALESGALEKGIAEVARRLWDRLLDQRPADWAARLSQQELESLRQAALRLYTQAAPAVARASAGRLPIGVHVESHINALDIRDVERMVRSVVDNELKWIVIFGVVIGFGAGLLMPVYDGKGALWLAALGLSAGAAASVRRLLRARRKPAAD